MNTWVLLTAILGTVLAGNWILRRREQQMAKARRGYGFEEFVAYFSGGNIPEENLRHVYNLVKINGHALLHKASDFSVQPLRSLCLCGRRLGQFVNHRDTENAEIAQRRFG